jgi:hypothetical protein
MGKGVSYSLDVPDIKRTSFPSRIKELAQATEVKLLIKTAAGVAKIQGLYFE